MDQPPPTPQGVTQQHLEAQSSVLETDAQMRLGVFAMFWAAFAGLLVRFHDKTDLGQAADLLSIVGAIACVAFSWFLLKQLLTANGIVPLGSAALAAVTAPLATYWLHNSLTLQVSIFLCAVFIQANDIAERHKDPSSDRSGGFSVSLGRICGVWLLSTLAGFVLLIATFQGLGQYGKPPQGFVAPSQAAIGAALVLLAVAWWLIRGHFIEQGTKSLPSAMVALLLTPVALVIGLITLWIAFWMCLAVLFASSW